MEMNKLIGKKIKFKQIVFAILVFSALANIIFFTFFYDCKVPNMLYYTYQSNLLVLIYYLVWMLGFYLMRFKVTRRLFSAIDHHLLKIFVGTNIVMTGIAAVFLIGPFIAIYNLLQTETLPAFSSIFTPENIYLGLNTVMLHIIIPLLVAIDFATDSTDSWNVTLAEILLPILYFVGYFLLVLIYGNNTGIFPYLPLDPTAYEITSAKYAIPIVSWVVSFGLLFIIGSGWVYNFAARNPINLQNGNLYGW